MPDSNHHTTTDHRDGDTVTFSCATCGYVRTMSLSTGDTKVIEPGDAWALHSGISCPVGIDRDYPMS